MKITCVRSNLSESLVKIQGAVGNSAIPALEGILFSAGKGYLTLTGYNLELGITTAINADIQEEGEVVLNARTFIDIIKKLPQDKVEISVDQKLKCTINCGKSKFEIIGINANEFPELPSVINGDVIKVDANILDSMVRQTRYAVAKNDDKPVYTGILFNTKENDLTLVGVDGYRLAVRKEKIVSSADCEFIVPEKSLSEMLKLIETDTEEINISIDKKHAIFKIGNFVLVTRLLEGNFIDYKSTVPKTNNIVAFAETKEILSMVERVSLVSNEKSKVFIKCNFEKDRLETSCESALGSANDEANIELEGEPVSIGFNSRFLIEALNVIEDDKIKISLNGSLQPMIISPVETDQFTFLILPVRIK